jgi:glutathione S-transferase
MPLELHYHPLSSYCWKALIALDELGIAFEPVLVNPGDPDSRAAFLKLSPFGKMPAVRDTDTGEAVFESSIVIDYLDQRHGGGARLIPAEPDAAREVRLWDRIFDLHVHDQMGRIVADRLRPEGKGDPLAVEQARGKLREAYAVLDRELAGRTWAAGEAFSLADCAAAPALFYADLIEPIGDNFPTLSAYLGRLRARPSVAKVIEGARDSFQYYPATPEERERLKPLS